MKILVRATNWVGDAVMNLPALDAIIAGHAGAEVHVLARPWVAPIFEAAAGVAGVIPYLGVRRRGSRNSANLTFRRAIRELRGLGFQRAYLLQNAFEAALLAFAARIPERIGYATDCRRLLLTTPVRVTPEVKRLHHVEYYLHILRESGLGANASAIPTLTAPQEVQARASKLVAEAFDGRTPRGYLVVCPGAAFGPAKRWFPDRFAKAIDHVWATYGVPSVLLGSESEVSITSAIAAVTSSISCDLAGKTSLLEAAGVLAQARAVLSNDSGLMHLAAAVGPPVVAIFASTDPTATKPLGDKHVIITSGVECAPCLKRECARHSYECMVAITVDTVCEALDSLLATDEHKLEVRG